MLDSEKTAETFSNIPTPTHIDPKQILDALNSYFPHLQKLLEEKDSHIFNQDDDMNSIGEKMGSTLPRSGTSIDDIQNIIINDMIPQFKYENVNFFGYIPISPAGPSVIAESLIPFFNQFIGAAIGSPIATAIEGQAIRWIGEMFGYTGDFFGNFSVGGSSANIEGIYTGIVSKIPWDYKSLGLIGNQRPLIYTSDQTHMCVKKAIMMLGLGLDSLKIIESNENFEISTKNLEIQIMEDAKDPNVIPLLIIGTSGTTNTGAIDDIEKLSQIANSNNMWLHIDAAYGGFARIATHPIAEKLQPLHLADSIATDTHKWLFTTLEGGCLLVKDSKYLKNAFEVRAEYLIDADIDESHTLIRNFSSYGFPLSRKWRGLMVWMNIKYYGVTGLSKIITKNILSAEYFAHKIREHENMTLTANPSLGVVCFRWKGDDELNNHIFFTIVNDSRFFIGRTVIKGNMTLRICVLNLESTIEKMDELLSEIENIAIKLET